MRRALPQALPQALSVLLLAGLLLCNSAHAATWTDALPLSAVVDRDGDLLVPAGIAVQIEVPSGDPLPEVWERPSTRDPETAELIILAGPSTTPDLRGVEGGLLVPLADHTRLLRVQPHGHRAWVRKTSRQDELTAWLDAQRQLDRSRPTLDNWRLRSPREKARDQAVDKLTLPWGSAATAAILRLRARAVVDRSVRALGTQHDLATLAPLHRTTHAKTSVADTLLSAGTPWSVDLQGPATVVVSLRPRANGAWSRSEISLELDRQVLPLDPLVGRGTAYRREELFLNPGVHRLRLTVPGVDVQARVEIAQLRRPLFGPHLPDIGEQPGDAFEQAELRWLRGDHAGSLEGFRAVVDQPGPRGELARARLLEATSDLRELAELAILPDGMSDDGRTAATDAILGRAQDLPTQLIEAAVLTAPEPDVVKVAQWLDTLGGQRSRGTALLRAARPLVDDGRVVAAAEVRLRGLSTRFTQLAPVPSAQSATDRREFTDRGPGIPRIALSAGQSATISLPEWGSRSPVLRLFSEPGTSWTLDGKSWGGQQGELAVGLAPGRHQLDVQTGSVYLLDPEITQDGTQVFERSLNTLPQAWRLPDPGASVDLRLDLDPPTPVRLHFDDGLTQDLEPGPDGVLRLTAGTWAHRVDITSLQPDQPVVAALELRVRPPETPASPPLPVTDIDGALLELTDLTRALDMGLVEARLARARLLGRMGLLTSARRDVLALLVGGDPELAARARSLAGNLAPVTPSVSDRGPTTAIAALAQVSDSRRLPAGPPDVRARALEEAAAAHGDDSALWLMAAQAWAKQPDLPRAWADLDRAGALDANIGRDLRNRLSSQTRWQLLAYASGGDGLVKIARPQGQPAADDGDHSADHSAEPLWKRARQAMLTQPWQEDDVAVLRGDVSDLLDIPTGTLQVEAWCRDETGPGAPCQVELRVGERRTDVEIPDGQWLPVDLPLATGPQEIEISGPGHGHALAVRTRLDGEPLPGLVHVTAQRAATSRPLVFELGGPLLVRVEPLRGQAEIRIDGNLVGIADAAIGDLTVSVVQAGTHRLEARGDIDLRVRVGVLREDLERLDSQPDPLADALLALPVEPLPVAVDELFSHLSTPPLQRLRAPGRGGSVEVGLSANAELLRSPTQRWYAGEVSGRWLHAGPHHWVQAGGWTRAPSLAGGLLAEAERIWTRSQLGLRLDAAGAPASAGQDSAGHVGARLAGRTQPSLGRSIDLRLEGRLLAGWWSAEGTARVDNKVWSSWSSQHPIHAVGLVSLVGSPMRDLRWSAGLRAVSNTGPSLDRIGPFASLGLIFPAGSVVGLSARIERRLVDDYRSQASTTGRLDLSLEHGFWESQRRWWRPWLRAGWRFDPSLGQSSGQSLGQPRGLVASGGLRVLFSPKRGLRDLPPGSVAFRSLRELP